MHIETVSETTLPQLLKLFAQYQLFYEATPDREKNAAFLGALLRDPEAGVQFVALEGDQMVGFATIYHTFSSVSAERTGTLNDLYTVPHARGKGVGSSLINHCADYLRACGVGKMIWLTHVDNEAAQRLYDTYSAAKEVWVEYTLSLTS